MKPKTYLYERARKLVTSLCDAANAGEYDTREKFHAMMEANPDLAVQGYNAYGKIFFWNIPSAHLYGYSETAAVNLDIFETLLPPEMRPFARDMISVATRTGKVPAASAYDLIRRNGEYVTVFSGHVMFQWENASTPEFYCLDLEIEQNPI
jgi:PAS domain S-box-containing protein